MTWNELNERTEDMLPDMLGSAWYDLIEDGGDEDPIWSCEALDMVIDVLKQYDTTTGAPLDAWGRLTDAEDIYEYKQTQQLIKELENIR